MSAISLENLDRLGIVAGLTDEIGIVEILNKRLGIDPREKVSLDSKRVNQHTKSSFFHLQR
jgi:Domain of unknown function (DUF4277)